MSVPESLVTAGVSVLGGGVTFALGQIFVKVVLEPVHVLKREIARVAYSLDYYAHRMFGDAPKADEARDAFRKHACRLRELASLVVGHRFWIKVLHLPSENDVILASVELIRLSNRPRDPRPGFDMDNAPEIKRLLAIRTADESGVKRQ